MLILKVEDIFRAKLILGLIFKFLFQLFYPIR